jgi:hypothetical protein
MIMTERSFPGLYPLLLLLAVRLLSEFFLLNFYGGLSEMFQCRPPQTCINVYVFNKSIRRKGVMILIFSDRCQIDSRPYVNLMGSSSALNLMYELDIPESLYLIFKISPLLNIKMQFYGNNENNFKQVVVV